MNFSDALYHIKRRYRLSRKGWNGQDMFVFLVPDSTFEINRQPLLHLYPEGTQVSYQSHIDIKTSDGTILPWTATQTDILAEDWFLYRKNTTNTPTTN